MQKQMQTLRAFGVAFALVLMIYAPAAIAEQHDQVSCSIDQVLAAVSVEETAPGEKTTDEALQTSVDDLQIEADRAELSDPYSYCVEACMVQRDQCYASCSGTQQQCSNQCFPPYYQCVSAC